MSNAPEPGCGALCPALRSGGTSSRPCPERELTEHAVWDRAGSDRWISAVEEARAIPAVNPTIPQQKKQEETPENGFSPCFLFYARNRLSLGCPLQTTFSEICPERKGAARIGDALTPTVGDALTPAIGGALTPAVGDALTPAIGDALTPVIGDALTCHRGAGGDRQGRLMPAAPGLRRSVQPWFECF